MPGSVKFFEPTAVFPETLSRAFTETQTFAANISEYHDGSAQQGALVAFSRHSWKLTERLPPTLLVALRDFMLLHIADNFWFYNPKETNPPNTSDPYGMDPVGRYAVRFNSNWDQSMGIALGDATVELIEVTSIEEAEMVNHLVDIWITLSPPKGIVSGGGDYAPPLQVLLPSDDYAFRCCAAVAKSKLGSTGTMDMLFKPPGGSYSSVFPGVIGLSGIAIDSGVSETFVSTIVDIPNGSDIRLDVQDAFVPAAMADELTLQVRGEVVRVI